VGVITRLCLLFAWIMSIFMGFKIVHVMFYVPKYRRINRQFKEPVRVKTSYLVGTDGIVCIQLQFWIHPLENFKRNHQGLQINQIFTAET
jgi:hypothetical protein